MISQPSAPLLLPQGPIVPAKLALTGPSPQCPLLTHSPSQHKLSPYLVPSASHSLSQRKVHPNSIALPHLSRYNCTTSACAALNTQCPLLMSWAVSTQLHTPQYYLLLRTIFQHSPSPHLRHFRFHKIPQDSLQPRAFHFHFHNFSTNSASAPSCPPPGSHLFTTSRLYQDGPLPAIATHLQLLAHLLTRHSPSMCMSYHPYAVQIHMPK